MNTILLNNDSVRVATVREKYLDNDIFSRSDREKTGIFWMAMDF